MTTSPVMGITEELLAELELHAQQAVCEAITDGFPYDPRIGLTTIEENFCVAANPATVLALIERIRSLSELLHESRDELAAMKEQIGYRANTLDVIRRIDAAIAREGADHE